MIKPWKAVLLVLISLAIFVGAYGVLLVRRGFSAREQPSALEATLVRATRRMATPRAMKDATNPFAATPEILQEARRHFADHCATCHANDGSGQTEIGQNLYPKAPDMRLAATQNLTDGEIYSIIHDGIRLSGMPAWGPASEARDDDSWKLVLFIRHLPVLASDEIKDMQMYNPKSEVDRREEEQEQEFLNGTNPK
jgi:mono/diheme cytochrome c family protein